MVSYEDQAAVAAVRGGGVATARRATRGGQAPRDVGTRPGAAGTSGRPSPHLRLTRRGRAVVWVASVAVAAAAGLTAQSASADAPSAAVAVEAYTVAPGDTLWQIARGLVGPGEDVRDVVAELEALNGLRGGALVAGQRMLLPAR